MGGLAALVMIGVVSATNVSAQVDHMGIDNEHQTMYAFGSGEIRVCFPTVKIDRETGEYKVTEKTWDIYEASYTGKNACIDLSKLNPTKDGWVIIKSDAWINSNEEPEAPILIHFSPATSNLKAVYQAATLKNASSNEVQDAKIQVINSSDKTVYTGDSQFEYRTAYGKWSDSIDMDYYQQEGATIFVREKASKMSSEMETLMSCGHASEYGTKIDGYTLIEAGHFAGKEMKVKVSALSSGPKVTTRWSSNSFKLPKGTEYHTGLLGSNGWQDVPESGILNLSDLDFSRYTDFGKVLEVRTKATTTKAASKVTRIDLKDIPKEIELLRNEGQIPISLSDITEPDTVTELAATEGLLTAKVSKTGTLTLKSNSAAVIEIKYQDTKGNTITTKLSKSNTKGVILKKMAGKEVAANYATVTTKGSESWASNAVSLGIVPKFE